MTQDIPLARFADAAVHHLTALHAVSTRLTLTDAERRQVDSPEEGVLEPGALWNHTRALFEAADEDGVDAGSAFDVGCAPLLLRWLEFADEADFQAEFGCAPSEALEATVGHLGSLARLVETLDQTADSGARHALARVWCRRARVLVDSRPRPLAQILEAIERALACPPETEEIVAVLLHCKGEVVRLLGDEGGERAAPLPIDLEATARLVCFWWMAAHGVGLLTSERRTLDVARHEVPLWSSVCRVVREERWDALPLPMPVELLDSLKASASCGMLDELVRVVELVLGHHAVPGPNAPGVVPVVSALVERRVSLETDWAETGGVGRLWHELHQGDRTPDLLERVELIRRLHAVLARSGRVVPFAPVTVYLDRASESEARGDHADERAALEAALGLSEALADREQREHAAVRLAALAWRQGEVTTAERLLTPLAGRMATLLRDRIRAAAPQRTALMEVLRAWQKTPNLVHGVCYAWSQQDAGHSVRALALARALAEHFPGGGVGEAVVGALALEQGRCRDAAAALDKARRSGFDEAMGDVLLAKALSGIGGDGAEQLAGLASHAREPGPILIRTGREVLRSLIDGVPSEPTPGRNE